MLKKDDIRDLGTEIRRMRKEMGMTLEALAEELDTDFRMISRYENGQVEMGAVMYRKLVQLYEQKTMEAALLQQIRKLSPQNRLALEEAARMADGRHMTAYMADINYFKEINDQHPELILIFLRQLPDTGQIFCQIT